MKKIMSRALICMMLLSTSITPAIANQVKTEPPLTKVDQIFDEFKSKVFLNGESMEEATEKLVGELIDSRVTSGQLQVYVAKNSSKEAYKKFNEVLDTTLEDVGSMQDLGQEDLSFILKNAFQSTHATGSNFISCSAGKTIGLPLIAVGVVLGIIALVNASASKEVVTKDFIDRRRRLTNDYLNTQADLELEVTTYESDIVYYQDEIEELQRKIDSGEYDAEEIEQFFLLIRDYEFFISDSQALIGEVNVDLAYFENQFNSDVAELDLEEVAALNEVDEKRSNASKQGVAAGIIGGLGAVFATVGLSDCN